MTTIDMHRVKEITDSVFHNVSMVILGKEVLASYRLRCQPWRKLYGSKTFSKRKGLSELTAVTVFLLDLRREARESA